MTHLPAARICELTVEENARFSDPVSTIFTNTFILVTAVLLAVTTGLRRSEIFALNWKDVDLQAKQIHVTRSIVQNVVGIFKTESSQKSVLAHDDLVEALRQWRGQTSYKSPENSMFASPVSRGR